MNGHDTESRDFFGTPGAITAPYGPPQRNEHADARKHTRRNVVNELDVFRITLSIIGHVQSTRVPSRFVLESNLRSISDIRGRLSRST